MCFNFNSDTLKYFIVSLCNSDVNKEHRGRLTHVRNVLYMHYVKLNERGGFTKHDLSVH